MQTCTAFHTGGLVMDAFNEKPQPPVQNHIDKIQAVETDFPSFLWPRRNALYSTWHFAREAHDLPPRSGLCIICMQSAGEDIAQERSPSLRVSKASIPVTPDELDNDDEEGWWTLAYQKDLPTLSSTREGNKSMPARCKWFYPCC
eukprot:gnl/MRDRNA2_/MRDRNA2_168612_c0_seq1.p1 gnl/MRDRNA2_/MRDRNA2_168612_c0~~gnl/MRDRNA2_/MRDRNA2_168612_c0_seq1.p1  ORF type:complete len:145 (+),score=26.04 gnl/MRDRNA2_/MRDRNA2_168612_c0_seq1:88-522(+)